MVAWQLIISLSLLSGLLILDKFAFGQFGFSLPLISAPLLGFLFGELSVGIGIGIIFQLLFIMEYPLGGRDLPDKEGGGICAIATFIVLTRHCGPENRLGALILSLLFGLIASFLGREMERGLKLLNERVAHLFGLVTSFVRGSLQCGALLCLLYYSKDYLKEIIRRLSIKGELTTNLLIPIILGSAVSLLFPNHILSPAEKTKRWQAIGLFLFGGLFAIGLWIIKR